MEVSQKYPFEPGEFDDIRPYRDNELPDRISQLISDPHLIRSASSFLFPKVHRVAPGLVRWLIHRLLKYRTTNMSSLNDLHAVLANWVAHLVRNTTNGFTYSGIGSLPRNKPCLFISNHRDIALDSIFVNYALWLNERPRAQIAVGDNLFTHGFEYEFMRINRSFLVVRSAETARARYNALMKTSRYIRHALEEGESVWIAQREGRSKDGNDLTDPAILKMFLLAYRGEFSDFDSWLNRVNVVPVSLSYEIDPCAPMKANELYTRETSGNYQKEEGEDLRSIVAGIRGFKGKIHIAFSPRIRTTGFSALTLAEHVDNQITSTLQPFDTYREAYRLLNSGDGSYLRPGKVKTAFEDQLAALDERAKPYLLMQYANQLHNNDPAEASTREAI